MKYFWWILLAVIVSLAILASCDMGIKYKIGTRVSIGRSSEVEEHTFNKCEDRGVVTDFDRTADGVFYTVKFPCLDSENRRVFREIDYPQSSLMEVKE